MLGWGDTSQTREIHYVLVDPDGRRHGFWIDLEEAKTAASRSGSRIVEVTQKITMITTEAEVDFTPPEIPCGPIEADQVQVGQYLRVEYHYDGCRSSAYTGAVMSLDRAENTARLMSADAHGTDGTRTVHLVDQIRFDVALTRLESL